MHKKWRVSVLVLSVGFSAFLAVSLATLASSRARAAETASRRANTYDLSEDQHSQTRQTFLEMLKDPELDSRSPDQLVEMLRSYRLDPVDAVDGISTPFPAIQDGPFVGYIIKNEVLDDWSSLYDSQYAENYKSYVTNITYEGMFDLLMQAIEANELPAQLQSVGGSVGECLAKRIEETSEAQGCSLDDSDALPDKPSLLKMAWMKYTCFIPFITSPCGARQAVFDYAKDQLIQAKKENLMAKVFPQIFPSLFRNNLIGGANKIRSDIGGFVSGKFQTQADQDLWQAPLIDLQDTQNRQTGLSELATGLAADIRGASVLLSSHPEVAAPLFYAAANRLLVLMGGTEVSWDPDTNSFALTPASGQDPKAPPKSITDIFGGIGVVQSATGREVVNPWDFTHYNPTASTNPTPLELLPSLFTLGASDVPSTIPGQQAFESMTDLGNLMSALVDFLELTQPGSNLASHFIDVDTDPDASSKITDAKNPALFPSEGRQLAAGLIAVIVQNMIAPNGHVVIPGASAPTIAFYNDITLDGRVPGKVPTLAVASVFGAASRFSSLASANDPDIPAQLLQLDGQVNSAIDISMLSMIGGAQQADGGFVDNLSDPASSERSLDTQVGAISSLTTVYSQTLEPAERLALRQAWTFLDHFWPAGSGSADDPGLPISSVIVNASGGSAPAPDATGLSAQSAWGLLNLWTQTLASPLYADLMNPQDDQVWGGNGWDQWQARFDALRKQLEAQLDTDQGPQSL